MCKPSFEVRANRAQRTGIRTQSHVERTDGCENRANASIKIDKTAALLHRDVPPCELGSLHAVLDEPFEDRELQEFPRSFVPDWIFLRNK